MRVLMVCMGNICRSPTAHGVLEKLVADAGWADRIAVDSAGTHGYHVGEPPDQARPVAEQRLVRHLDGLVGDGQQPGAGERGDHLGRVAGQALQLPPGHASPDHPAAGDAAREAEQDDPRHRPVGAEAAVRLLGEVRDELAAAWPAS